MPKLQQRRFEEPLCRVSTGPFLCQYEFAFARCGRWSGRAGRCDWQSNDTRSATERPFQEAQSSDKMVIRQADLVVSRHLVCGARCVRAFGHVTRWAGVVFPGDSIRPGIPGSLSSPIDRRLAT